MAKLIFRYAAMCSGKSAEILQIYRNYQIRNIKGICLIPSIDTASDGAIKSRFSEIIVPAIKVNKETNLFDIIVKKISISKNIKFIIIDESNFLTKQQAEQLGKIVDELNITVMAYGLMTNFKGELFEGSKRLLEISDRIEQIYVRSRCKCGKTAIFNARFINGKYLKNGQEIIIDKKNGTTNNIEYVPMCRKCFNEMIQK